MNLTLEIPVERIYSLLVSAFEGGSNYWYMIQDRIEPAEGAESVYLDTLWNDKRAKDPSYIHSCELPFNGGALMIDDEQADEPELKTPVRLDLERIKYGFDCWAIDAMKEDGDETRSAHPCHLANLIKGDDDAETADVFLQYCVFGKVIYG